MRQQDRLGLILEALNERGSVTVPDLAGRLAVSEASVRRDLALLEKQKLLTRTHGGAVASGVLYELPMRYRGGQQHEAKRAIAAAAAAMVTEAASVALNGGTTTTEVARELASRPGLRVVTNALNIASELVVRPNIDLVMCGGNARSNSYELVGPLAELTLAHINVDVAILGVDGIDPVAGFTTHHEVEAQTNRALLRAASRVVVVADASKLGRRGFAKISDIGSVTDIVTDARAPRAALTELDRLGPCIHLVEVPAS